MKTSTPMHNTALVFWEVVQTNEPLVELPHVSELEFEEVSFAWGSLERMKVCKQVFVTCYPDQIVVSHEKGWQFGFVEREYDVKDWKKEELVALFKEILNCFIL